MVIQYLSLQCFITIYFYECVTDSLTLKTLAATGTLWLSTPEPIPVAFPFQAEVICWTLFFSAFFIFKTSITNTIMAMNRPNKVQMNTPPKDLSVIPSESSRIGQSLRLVLFQYLPDSFSKYSLFCNLSIDLLISSFK